MPLLLIHNSLPVLVQATQHGCLLSECQMRSRVQALCVFGFPKLFSASPCQCVTPAGMGSQESDPNINIYCPALHSQSSIEIFLSCLCAARKQLLEFSLSCLIVSNVGSESIRNLNLRRKSKSSQDFWAFCFYSFIKISVV